MKVPDKIYIAETPNKLIEIWGDEPIETNPYITEHEYIRKDALLEWLKLKTETAEIVVANSVDRWVTRQVYKQVMNKLEAM